MARRRKSRKPKLPLEESPLFFESEEYRSLLVALNERLRRDGLKQTIRSEEFIVIAKAWNLKLKRHRFKDVETSKSGKVEPFVRPQVMTMDYGARVRADAGLDVSGLALSRRDSLIWQFHCEGFTQYAILQKLGPYRLGPIGRSTVGDVIEKIRYAALALT